MVKFLSSVFFDTTVLGGAANGVIDGTGNASINGGIGINDVALPGYTTSQATISTNGSALATITFAGTMRTAALASVNGVF